MGQERGRDQKKTRDSTARLRRERHALKQLGLNGGHRDGLLTLRRPRDSTGAELEDVTVRRLAGVDIVAVSRVGVADERRLTAAEDEAVVGRSAHVAENPADCNEVVNSRSRHVTS